MFLKSKLKLCFATSNGVSSLTEMGKIDSVQSNFCLTVDVFRDTWQPTLLINLAENRSLVRPTEIFERGDYDGFKNDAILSL